MCDDRSSFSYEAAAKTTTTLIVCMLVLARMVQHVQKVQKAAKDSWRACKRAGLLVRWQRNIKLGTLEACNPKHRVQAIEPTVEQSAAGQS